MDITGRIHPSTPTKSATIPVNAPTASAAIRAVRETLAKSGRTLTTVSLLSTEPVRPFTAAAITFPGSTSCFILRVEYTK